MIDEADRKRFGEHIRGLRTAKRMSLREVERLTGISNAYVSQLERGARNPPSRRMVETLADLYGVDREELMRLAGYEAPGRELQYEPEVIDRAFRFVSDDPAFTFGMRHLDKELPPSAKVVVIQMYERLTGFRLLPNQFRQEVVEPKAGETA